MSLPRYVINFEELTDDLFDNKDEHIEISKGKQYSKGFHIDLHKDTSLEYEIQEDILINAISISSTEKSKFGNTNFNLILENKLGNKKNYIFENFYIKDIFEQKQMYGYLRANISDKIKIEFNNIDGVEHIFIDIDYLKREKEDNV